MNRVIAFVVSLGLILTPLSALARGGGILLDAETADLFRTYADPLINVAGLKPQNIAIYLEATNQVNAFASPGRIVLFSGLVLKTKTPDELQSILAHEIAHIVAGHIPTLVRQRQKAGLTYIASQIIGFGAIIAGLAPLGVLILAAGSSAGAYSALGETRTAEASADQAALSYLDRAGISGKGMLSFFKREFLPRETAYAYANRTAPNPYLRTHPLSRDRLEFLGARVTQMKSYNNKTPKELQFAHDMVLAKLHGFIHEPNTTLNVYSDNSMPARYARAVMFAYHLADIEKSLGLINGLIRDQKNNPYFHAFKGYILSRSTNYGEAVKSYQKAISLLPYNLVMRLEIGAVLINANNPRLVLQGIEHLKLAARDPTLATATFRPIARGYGLLGNIGLAELATAEALLLEDKMPSALRHAKRALKKIPLEDKISRLRAQDIVAILEDKTDAKNSKSKNKK